MGKILDLLKKSGLSDEDQKKIQAEAEELEKEFEKKPDPVKPKEKEEEPVKTPAPKPEPTGDATMDKLLDAVSKTVKANIDDALQPVNDRLKTLEGDVESRKTASREAEIEKVLDDAVKAGRIEPAKRDEWKSDLTESFDVVKKLIERQPENPALKKAAESGETEKKKEDGGGTNTPASTAFERGANQDMLKVLKEEIAANA